MDLKKKADEKVDEVKKISVIVGEELFKKIEKECQKQNLEKSELIMKILLKHFDEESKNIIKLESSPYAKTEEINDSFVGMADFDSYRFKRIANKFNENGEDIEREKIENEYCRMLREKKRKEYNNGRS